MKTAFAAICAAIMLSAFAACAASPQTRIRSAAADAAPLDAQRLAAARELYEQRCARCHKSDGAGGTIQIDAFSLKVPNLNDARVVARTDDDYRRKIENGGDGMPKFRDKLAPAQIADAVRFIRLEIQGK